MRETQAIIERARRVSSTIQQLDLAIDAALAQLKPGQSLFISPLERSGWVPYLREQWIPVNIEPGRLTVELPVGAVYSPGHVVSVLGPVGRPITLRPKIHHMLMIAEDAMPTPLIWLARTLTGGGVAVTLVLGGHATTYPLELLSPEVEVIHSDTDWKWPDQVEMLQWADQVLVLAPTHTQMDVYARLYDTLSQLRHHDIPDNFVSGLFFHRLACGAGACEACQVPARKGRLLACTDGPAIDLRQVTFI